MASYKNIEEYRRKKKVKKVLRGALVILALCAVLALVLFATHYFQDTGLADKITGGLDKEVPKFPLTIKKEQLLDVLPLGEGFAVLSKSNILTYAPDGKRQQTIPHGYTNPVMKSAGKRLLTYDRGGNRLRVDTSGGTVEEITTETAILSAELSGSGQVAVTLQYRANQPVVLVYDANMKIAYRYMDTEEFTSVAFSGDGKRLLLADIVTRQGLLSGLLYELDITSEADAVVTEIPDFLPLSAVYAGDRRLVAGQEGVLSIAPDGTKRQWDCRGSLLRFGILPSGMAVMVTENLFSNHVTVTLVSADGTAVGSVDLDDDVMDVTGNGEGVLVLGQEALYFYDLDMKQTKEIPLSTGCHKAAVNGTTAYLLHEDGILREELD